MRLLKSKAMVETTNIEDMTKKPRNAKKMSRCRLLRFVNNVQKEGMYKPHLLCGMMMLD